MRENRPTTNDHRTDRTTTTNTKYLDNILATMYKIKGKQESNRKKLNGNSKKGNLCESTEIGNSRVAS